MPNLTDPAHLTLTRLSRLLVLLLLVFAGTDPAFARLPKPIQTDGTVLAVDLDTHTLVFKSAKTKKPFILDWNDKTVFVENEKTVSASALKNGTTATVQYRSVTFHNPLLLKVSWSGSKDTEPRNAAVQK